MSDNHSRTLVPSETGSFGTASRLASALSICTIASAKCAGEGAQAFSSVDLTLSASRRHRSSSSWQSGHATTCCSTRRSSSALRVPLAYQGKSSHTPACPFPASLSSRCAFMRRPFSMRRNTWQVAAPQDVSESLARVEHSRLHGIDRGSGNRRNLLVRAVFAKRQLNDGSMLGRELVQGLGERLPKLSAQERALWILTPPAGVLASGSASESSATRGSAETSTDLAPSCARTFKALL